MKENRTLCCSSTCKRLAECGLHYTNNIGEHYIEDWSNFGSGTFTDKGCIIEDWCGESGNYKMFEPIRLTEDEFYRLHCCMCGSQRCEGIGTDWFEGCKYKEHLSK